MKVSKTLAEKTHALFADWTTNMSWQTPAIDSFLGDIYSGLQAASWSDADRGYAQQHLFILSGLYGVLAALDGIYPYRLEMGYKLPSPRFGNLYTYWGHKIADSLPKQVTILNLAATEYSKVVTPFVEHTRIITPSFLTVSPKTGRPTFVVVHTKIARGAFARWIVQNRINDPSQLHTFAEIGYDYNSSLSTANQPVFVCSTFDGIGLSMRLS